MRNSSATEDGRPPDVRTRGLGGRAPPTAVLRVAKIASKIRSAKSKEGARCMAHALSLFYARVSGLVPREKVGYSAFLILVSLERDVRRICVLRSRYLLKLFR